MARARVIKLNNEVVTALCHMCECCLPDSKHCAICHMTRSVETLCGCGECPSALEDYIVREKLRLTKVKLDREARKIAA